MILPSTGLRQGLTIADHIRRSAMSKELMKRSTGENLGRMTVSVGASFFEYGWQLRRLGPRDFTIEQHVLRPGMAGDMLGLRNLEG